MTGGAPQELRTALAALERALAALADEESQQESRVEEAEFGRHGQSDLIQAESERLDRLRESRDAIASAVGDLREAAKDLEDLL